MTLTRIALQNLRRRKGRTAFLLLTFSLVTAIIVGLQALSAGLKEDLQKSLTRYGANVIVTPRSEQLALSYSGISVPGVSYNIQPLSNNILAAIKQDSETGIQTTAPKVIGKVQGPNKPLLVVGVDFPSELKMKPWWAVIGSEPGDGQIVAGALLAKQYNLTTGSTFQINSKTYSVSGVMQETGNSEDNVIFTDISTARALTGNQDSWTMIELNSLQPDLTVAKIRQQLPNVKAEEISQLVQGTRDTINRFDSYALFASLLLILIGLLIVVVTVTANVNSRVSELGIFQAMGYRQRHILTLLLREILIISLSGGVIGYLLGIALPLLVGPLIFQKVLEFHFFPVLAVSTIGASLVTACITMVFPVWRATRLDPVEALRYI